MSNSDPLSEQPPLERAIHRLREAQTLHNPGEYDPVRQDAANEMVDLALGDIDEHVTGEMERLKEQLLAHRGESE